MVLEAADSVVDAFDLQQVEGLADVFGRAFLAGMGDDVQPVCTGEPNTFETGTAESRPPRNQARCHRWRASPAPECENLQRVFGGAVAQKQAMSLVREPQLGTLRRGPHGAR